MGGKGTYLRRDEGRYENRRDGGRGDGVREMGYGSRGYGSRESTSGGRGDMTGGGRGGYSARGGGGMSRGGGGSYGSGPSSPRRPPYAARTDEDDPRLATTPRIPNIDSVTLETLEPKLLSALRLSLMQALGRTPSPTELSEGLPRFLSRERGKDQKEMGRLASKIARTEKTNRDLDIAWEWGRKREEALGIGRDAASRVKDEAVRRRLEAREAEKPIARKVRREQKEEDDDEDDEDDDDDEEDDTQALPSDAPYWMIQRAALKSKFPEGWAPPKRLSREAISLIRLLQQSSPSTYTTPVLADRFKVSPEAIRRILKSQFELSEGEVERRETKRKEEREAERAAGGYRGSWAGDTEGERREMEGMRERERETRASVEERRDEGNRSRYGSSGRSSHEGYEGGNREGGYGSDRRGGYGQRGGRSDDRGSSSRGRY